MPETQVFRETVERQQLVASPDVSAWVAANAGSGKTKVLTDRVMRLLLTGTPPSKILCITFTKAAAAEMAERLFGRLGKWALMEDKALTDELAKLDGVRNRTADELSEARKLFARALETPGGLKIQTIHSFCESVLKRFPLEANVSPGFSVMEERAAEEKLREILDGQLITALSENAELAERFLRLSRLVDEESLRQDVFFLVSRAAELRAAVNAAGGLKAYYDQLKFLLNTSVDNTIEEIISNCLGALDRPWLEGAYSAFLTGKKNDQDRAAKLRLFLDEANEAAAFTLWQEFLLTKGAPRKKLADSAAKDSLPGLEERLRLWQEALLDDLEKIKGRHLFETTRTICDIALLIQDKYSRYKQVHGFLDFDDLIEKTVSLFRETAPAWVLYKLDQGIDHLLLDEAQDTSDGQWRVVMQPLLEFFAGEGGREVNRTVFVVGDEKQSIYSFQGADVNLFRSQQNILYELVTTAERSYVLRDLTLSFRSTAPILDFVDTVFADPMAAKGVSDQVDLRHYAHRSLDAGRVELWPLVEREKTEGGNPWDAPVDMPSSSDPSYRLADHIGGTISNWLSSQHVLPSKGRPIQPGDIMILCQRRGPVFHELVKALARYKVPTAGADRIVLKEHVATKDMIAAMRFILQHRDDLSLAELLKSPLFGFDDEDLFELAYNRPANGSLWDEVGKQAQKPSRQALAVKCNRVVTELTEARSQAILKGPYAFFSTLLAQGRPSGWQRMYSRLGLGAEEVLVEWLNEALEYERAHPRSLQGFSDHVEKLDAELKKELEAAQDQVRIMTVHGSKGLEANIIFLADAAYSNTTKVGSFLPLGEVAQIDGQSSFYEPKSGFFVRSSSKQQDNHAAVLAREASVHARSEEYRRLFYVAATRARDRLIICGQTQGNKSKETILAQSSSDACWYTLAERAFQNLDEDGKITMGAEVPWGGHIRAYESLQTVSPEVEEKAAAAELSETPEWIYQDAAGEVEETILNPSRFSLLSEADPVPRGTSIESAHTPLAIGEAGITIYTRGNALHLLLEKLPGVPAGSRREVAIRLLSKHFATVEVAIHEEWIEEVLSILNDARFGPVFSSASKAEVPLTAELMIAGKKQKIVGQIDRLAVYDNHVFIIDYKSNRPPPAAVTEVPLAYLRQMAVYRKALQEIYPQHEITCGLLWTWSARLMHLPADMLDHALVHSMKPETGVP